MQFACLLIVFDHTKFQPHSVSHSTKTSPPSGDQERSVGEIFLKLCEAYEAKTAPASSLAICAESLAWISLSNDRMLFYSSAACSIQLQYMSVLLILSFWYTSDDSDRGSGSGLQESKKPLL